MIAIVFALEFESAAFAAKHDRQLRVATWLLGAMGAAAPAILEKKLEQTRPRLIISAGFAGGLQSELKVGDLVLGTNYSEPEIAGRLQLGARWRRGKILTAPAIVEQSVDKQRLGQGSGCEAVDLETAHLAAVCASCGIPILSIRCISDAMEDDMPVPADVLLHPQTHRPDSLALFRHLITNPSSVGAFNRLLKNAKTAQRALAEGLDEVLPQLLHLT